MSELTFEEVFDPIAQAAVGAFNELRDGVWATVKNVVLLQLKQIATAIVDVAAGLTVEPPYYTVAGAQVLVQMCVTAATQTIAAATELVITEVQVAIRKILDAVRDTITQAVQVVLF
ncbi:hypothetical protein [Rhodovibrio salinarum]|uniref:Uncharacterized protein n=1 Tax=Rhodovibrio salinarum TaxID=1087 RepID=A0A934UY98_9PROT|nr:hypothetical protein [Rhodovibrio salinarum]MBK1695743.1 hypothetical protein [Rhodovibrio salinarum]